MSGRLIQRIREPASRLEANTVHRYQMSEISEQKNYITHEILRGVPAVPQGILGEVVRAFHK